MKQKLLLTSQGIQPELEEVFLSCLDKEPSEISVAFITTAAYGEENNSKWLEIHKDQLRHYGIVKITELDLNGKKQEQLRSELAGIDMLFINGGNTFYLLHHVRESGFDKLLPELLDKGKFYVGVSAGSYIICPTIEAATWKHAGRNKVGLKDLSALNLVPFLITAHFEERYRIVVEEAAKNTVYPIIALCDTQAVLVEDNNYKLVGKGEKEFFNGFSEKWKSERKF